MKKNHKLSAAATLLSALAATNAMGQVSNWTNSSGGNWSLMTNWDAAVPLVSPQSAVLGLSSTYTVDLDTNADIGVLSVTNPNATLRIPSARTFGLNGPTATNNGIITLNHTGSGTNSNLSINADTSLSGTGEIWLRAYTDNAQINGAGTLTNGVNHTIRGVGLISAPMVNDGVVRGDVAVSVSGSDLDLDGALTNNGLLEAATNSNLDILAITIDQTGGGMIVAQDGGNVNTVSGSAVILGGSINSIGTGEFNVNTGTSPTLTGVTNNGFIDVRLGGTLGVNGAGFTNNGTVALNQTGSATDSSVRYLSSGNLDGTGEMWLRAYTDNSRLETDAGMVITHAASHTIRGVGQINAAMTNNGTISADVSVSVSGSDLDLAENNKVNNGSMTAEAGSYLDIVGIAIDQLSGGSLVANGGTIRLLNATVEGGVFASNAGGVYSSEASATNMLSGVTLNGPLTIQLASAVEVDGDGLVNNDVMQLNPQGSAANSTLAFTENATLGGSGEIWMRSYTDNSQVNTAAEATLTHASTHLIRGVGEVNAAVINNGEIRADSSVSVSGSDLDLQTNDKVNNGLVVSAAASYLDINGITIDQAGGGMLVADGGEIRLNSAAIQGGDYVGIGDGLLRSDSGTQLLSGVTLDGPSEVDLGTTIQVDGDGLTNNGVMQMNPFGSSSNAILVFIDNATLDGTGEVRMGSYTDNTQVNTEPGFTVTHGADHQIRGAGQINAAMYNEGTVSADASVSSSGSVLELQTSDKTNAGVMSAEAGSTLEITGITLLQTGSGEIQSNDGMVSFNGGATLSGGSIEFTGAGEYEIAGSSSATFHNVISNAPGEVKQSSTLSITGTGFVNHDLLRVNPFQSSADGVIAFPADGTLSGSGEVNLFASLGDSQIAGPGTVTNASGHAISGRGTVSAPFINQGTINPGNNAVGTLNASSGVTLSPTSVLNIELAGNNSSDRLAVTGTANLGGTLNVAMFGASMPTLNYNYTILTADNVVGTFDNDSVIIDGNLITRVVYEPTQVRLLTRCIADTNLDGAVTAADFSAWVSAFNAGSDIADQNFDGNVSPADFSAWVANFNQGCP